MTDIAPIPGTGAPVPSGGPVTQFSSLYVGDLHLEVTEAMLFEIFNSVGPVASIRVCRDNISRKSLGYAYVNFHSVQDAERALDTLNYSNIKGRSCRIMWSHRDPNLRKTGPGNVFVKNLDKNIDNKSLYDTFSLFGNILSCKVAKDREGRSKGYGFVHFETAEAGKEAIEKVNDMTIGEKKVFVGEFVKRQERDTPEITNFTNLYVKNFPSSHTEDDLKKLFEAYGKITSLALTTDKQGRKFAFVNFEESAQAKKAIDELHEKQDFRTEEQKQEDDADDRSNWFYCLRAQTKDERERNLRDQFAQTPTGTDPRFEGVNLYVKNLHDEMGESELKNLFATFGAITSVAVMKDDANRSKGFGFVSFKNSADATKAVAEMHLKVIKGKPLYVGLAEKKEDRTARLATRYKSGAPTGFNNGMGFDKGFGQKGLPGMMGQGQMYPPQMMYGPRPGMARPGMPMGMPMGYPGPMGMPMMMGKGPMSQMPMQGRPPMNLAPGARPAMGMPGQGYPPYGGKPGLPGGMGKATQRDEPLNAAALAAAPPGMQKQMLGEKLFPRISRFQPELAGKITGMMLEMDNAELLVLLESDQSLKNKVDEAMVVLEQMKAKN